MNRSHGVISAVLLAALSSAACAHHGAPGPVALSAAVDSCATPLPATPHDTLVIALTEPGDAERVVFRQLRSAAPSVSCSGAVRDSGVYARSTDSAGRLLATPAFDSVGGYPALVFRSAIGGDARDLIDGRADLIVTRDPATLAYAERLPDFVTVPLAWDRTYVLISPTPLNLTRASDAVRTEARPAPPCAAPTAGVTAKTGRRIVYPAGDPSARDLAERLAALQPGLSPTPLAPGGLDVALQSAADAAYIVAVPHAADACTTPVRHTPPGWVAYTGRSAAALASGPIADG